MNSPVVKGRDWWLAWMVFIYWMVVVFDETREAYSQPLLFVRIAFFVAIPLYVTVRYAIPPALAAMRSTH